MIDKTVPCLGKIRVGHPYAGGALVAIGFEIAADTTPGDSIAVGIQREGPVFRPRQRANELEDRLPGIVLRNGRSAHHGKVIVRIGIIRSKGQILGLYGKIQRITEHGAGKAVGNEDIHHLGATLPTRNGSLLALHLHGLDSLDGYGNVPVHRHSVRGGAYPEGLRPAIRRRSRRREGDGAETFLVQVSDDRVDNHWIIHVAIVGIHQRQGEAVGGLGRRRLCEIAVESGKNLNLRLRFGEEHVQRGTDDQPAGTVRNVQQGRRIDVG